MLVVDPNKVTGVVLAGGLARRMQNQDKGLVLYKGLPLAGYAVQALSPLVSQVLVNANRNIAAYQQFACPVIADQTDHFDGPLAGILTAMRVANTEILLVTPCDSPLVETSHLRRLLATCIFDAVDVAVAYDGQCLHPVFLALKCSLADSLQIYLDQGERKIQLWLHSQHLQKVDFSDVPEIFTNINTLNELTALESRG